MVHISTHGFILCQAYLLSPYSPPHIYHGLLYKKINPQEIILFLLFSFFLLTCCHRNPAYILESKAGKGKINEKCFMSCPYHSG
jgi:hypothetical protein